MEEIVSCFQGGEEIGCGGDVGVGGGGQLIGPCVPSLDVCYEHRLVGPEGGEHLGLVAACGEWDVVFQVVDWVIGGADGADIELLADGECGESFAIDFGVGEFPDFVGCVRAEDEVGIEVAFQFEVCPVVQWVAHGLWNRACPGVEFFFWVGVFSGDQMLWLAGCAHGAPFVVVATEPHLGEIGKSDIACDFCRVEVAVVVHDRLVGSYFVVETLRRLVWEEEVFVQVRHQI